MPQFALQRELCCYIPSQNSLELKGVLIGSLRALQLALSRHLCTPHPATGSGSLAVNKLSLEEGERPVFGPFPARGTQTHRPTCLGNAHEGQDIQGGKVPGAKLMVQVLWFPGEKLAEVFLPLLIPTQKCPYPHPHRLCFTRCPGSPWLPFPVLCWGHGWGQMHQHIHLSRQQAENLS